MGIENRKNGCDYKDEEESTVEEEPGEGEESCGDEGTGRCLRR